jgi:hypothetical protein
MAFKKTCPTCGETFEGKACPKCLGRSFAKTLEDKPAHSTDERLDYIAARLTEINDRLGWIFSRLGWCLAWFLLWVALQFLGCGVIYERLS